MSSVSSLICSDSNGSCFSMCISNNKCVYSFGYSEYFTHGQNNDTNIILSPTMINNLVNIKMISCGGYHSICLDYNGYIYSFGSNTDGQLGINKTGDELEFSHIPLKIDLPLIKSICCGYDFTICLSEEGFLYSFGYNEFGQLGIGQVEQSNSPSLISDINNITFVKCGGHHVLCISYDDKYYCWGFNDCGQLGFESSKEKIYTPIECNNLPDNIIDIKCGYYHTLTLTSTGNIYSFGDNIFGQLGINEISIEKQFKPTLIKDIPEMQRIECGNDHSMCIDINNNLWVFGANEYGQLGLGNKVQHCKPIQHSMEDIIDISSGGNHTFIKTIDNKIYTFGQNNNSQLGIKTSESNQLTPIQVFIDNEDIWCSTIGKSKAKSARK